MARSTCRPPDPAWIVQNILLWQEENVHSFFCSLGFTKYEDQIRGQWISGSYACGLATLLIQIQPADRIAGARARTPIHPRTGTTEHGISGEILVHLDHEALKDVGIHSVVRCMGLGVLNVCACVSRASGMYH